MSQPKSALRSLASELLTALKCEVGEFNAFETATDSTLSVCDVIDEIRDIHKMEIAGHESKEDRFVTRMLTKDGDWNAKMDGHVTEKVTYEPPKKILRVVSPTSSSMCFPPNEGSLWSSPTFNCGVQPPSHMCVETCALCFDTLADKEGFGCPQDCGTFTCWDCLVQSYKMAAKSGAIQGGSNTKGELLCPEIKCRFPLTVTDLSKSSAPEAVLKAQEDFKIHILTNKRVSEALRQQEGQIRAEYARIEQIKDADEKAAAKLHRKIVDECLTLRCPRCETAFVDFDNCFAVNCCNNACRCGFCAWCLTDCGQDAHAHVKFCGEGKGDRIFGTEQDFRDHHRKKRICAIQELVKKSELSATATQMLRELVHRDLADLNIPLNKVFPTAQRTRPGNHSKLHAALDAVPVPLDHMPWRPSQPPRKQVRLNCEPGLGNPRNRSHLRSPPPPQPLSPPSPPSPLPVAPPAPQRAMAVRKHVHQVKFDCRNAFGVPRGRPQLRSPPPPLSPSPPPSPPSLLPLAPLAPQRAMQLRKRMKQVKFADEYVSGSPRYRRQLSSAPPPPQLSPISPPPPLRLAPLASKLAMDVRKQRKPAHFNSWDMW